MAPIAVKSLCRLAATVLMALLAHPAAAAPDLLGDLDEDQVFTANDLAMLVGHSAGTHPLPSGLQPFADLTQDGFVNDADHTALISLILETSTPQSLPLATVREMSPSSGEGDVAVTRETVLYFSMPLALNAGIDTTKLKGEFGGRKILSRVEISSDRKKATLFYLEPLPSNARIQVSFDSTGVNDLLGRAIDGDGDAQPGGLYQASFDTLSITPVAGTAISGRVFASERGTGGNEVPLAGVTVTVDGAEETLRAVTDALGNFTLSPCPAGTFFVHVDGRTSPASSWPNGDYYPVVGKRWDALAGRTDNLSGNNEDTIRGAIFLPKVLGISLTTVSASQETLVELPASITAANPALAGTRLSIPSNSLFADDGTRGGRVGVAPVAPDRLPSPLPPGLNLPMVITIQTDGATNFDRPVPVSFPNLPDPVTGLKLAPGVKSALWSFNHDIGQWEVVGPMTVTEDGQFVKTDAGVGVLQPGWHGQRPGSSGEGPAVTNQPPPPECIPGTNASPPFGPCSSSPTENNRRRAACFASGVAGVGAGVIARNVLCQVPGVPMIFKALCKQAVKKTDVTDPIRAASLSRLCQQYYLDCNLNPGELPPPMPCPGSPSDEGGLDSTQIGITRDHSKLASKMAAQSSIDPYSSLNSELAALEADIQTLEVVYDQARQIAGNATTPDELNVDQLKLFLDLELVLKGITGGRSDEEFLRPRLTRIDGYYRQLLIDAALMSSDRAHYLLENLRTGLIQRGRSSVGGGMQGLILESNENYKLIRWFPGKRFFSSVYFRSAAVGAPSRIPAGPPIADAEDADFDGLGDVAETVLGTSSMNGDTDGDGLNDGAEMAQGSNPLDGFIATTGVIASVPTTAPATDVHVLNNLAITANGSAGITIFNVQSGLNPTRVADIDSPGMAMAVASDGEFAAVADYFSGLMMVNISDLAAVRITAQLPLGAPVQSVAVSGGIAFAGTTTGQIVAVDLSTAAVLNRLNLASVAAIQDLTVWRDTLFALQVGKVTAVSIETLAQQGALTLSGPVGAGGRRWRLFAGESTLYATHTSGFNIVNIGANPNAPTLVQNFTTQQFGWKQIVANGSGLGIAAVSPNSTNDGEHHIDLYQLGADQRTPAFGTTFPTPGLASAVSIYNGLAYVADSAAGLQVVSYLPYDNQKQVPTITLTSNLALDQGTKTGTAEEGKSMRLSAAVTDDVQVRNVEFYVNGQLSITDGNYPFEHRFTAPALNDGSPTFKIKAKATDTGGNVAWTDEFTITLSPDATPPTVVAVNPLNNALTGGLSHLYASFSEPMNATTLAAGFKLMEAGADKTHGTVDDVIRAGEISYRENLRMAFMAFTTPLAPGSYRLTVQTPVSDAVGNALAAPFVSSFRVYDAGLDSDGDGVPDEYEPLLGLNATKTDTNNNGVPDGLEDFDNDGLKNAAEFVTGTNPMIADTNGNGILDGNEDTDMDGLTDSLEVTYGTSHLLVDTDGDGWDDGTELAEGSDPKLANQRPLARVRSASVSIVNCAPQSVPQNLANAAASLAISYLDASPEPLPAARETHSGQVSYRNDSQTPSFSSESGAP